MEAANTSETSIHFYQTTRLNIPEDSHLHTRRRENLKSHLIKRGRSLFVLRFNIYVLRMKMGDIVAVQFLFLTSVLTVYLMSKFVFAKHIQGV
jgi:hypothetical protein